MATRDRPAGGTAASVLPARERLAKLLGELPSPGAFSAKATAPPDGLAIAVRGVGPLRLPITDEQAEALVAIGRPARFGRGEETLVDSRVRRTAEVAKSRVKVDKRRWNATLAPVLEQLRGDLGLPAGCHLEAELHSMLVYGPGDHFASHQDSEKADGMVGTLVVTLPGSFKGGALVVTHDGASATYRGSARSLSFVGFYADCRHEVRPVTAGYRVVLTYNLVLHGDTVAAWEAGAAGAGQGGSEAVEHLAGLLRAHFSEPVPAPSWRSDGEPTPAPRRLVYLLDHEYTPRALGWSLLKRSDARKAALLLAAASRAECEAVLAVADVQETWSCFEPDRRRSFSRRRYGSWGYEDDSSSAARELEADDYELDDLIDATISLSGLVERSGARLADVASHVRDSELCATRPSVELAPYAFEHEGYMGNYGNTMDRWYHRAAIVCWPRDLAFAVRAEASPGWALTALGVRLRARDVEGARQLAASMAPFWDAAAAGPERRGLVGKALRVARDLDDAEVASMLLSPFCLEYLTRADAKAIAGLAARFGEAWARAQVTTWSARSDRVAAQAGRDRASFVAGLGSLCEALASAPPGGREAASLLLGASFDWLSGAIGRARALEAPSRREVALTGLGPSVRGLLDAAAVIEAPELRDEALGLLSGPGEELSACALGALRSKGRIPDTIRDASGLATLATHWTERLQARLARPARDGNDWSIEAGRGCGCGDCEQLERFLADPAQRRLEWPLAEQRRRHVHVRITAAELPVRHETRRKGSPYTLVLEKTDALFSAALEQRRRDEVDLAFLVTTLKNPSGRSPRRAQAGVKAPRRRDS